MDVEQVQPTVLPNEDGSIFNNLKVLNVGNGTLRVDKNGMSVAGTVIVDANGLNSLNNFRSDFTDDLAAFETTSTSYVDVTGGTMASFTLERTAQVLYVVNLYGRNRNVMDSSATLGYDCSVQLYDNDAAVSKVSFNFAGAHVGDYTFGTPDTWTTNSSSAQYCKVNILETVAGTHTLKLQLRANGGGIARISSADFGYLILGI